MITYLVVNLLFVAAVLGILKLNKIHMQLHKRPILITVGVLLILTAVFDSCIVGLDIVSYDTSKIIGAYVGRAPIEDFFYAILAVILVPILWKLLGKSHD